MSEGCFNHMVQLMGETMPEESRYKIWVLVVRKLIVVQKGACYNTMKILTRPQKSLHRTRDDIVTMKGTQISYVIHPMTKLGSILIYFIQNLVKTLRISY
ncbi:hypothetical protein CR513_54280, partial [Mucuna pruriens]